MVAILNLFYHMIGMPVSIWGNYAPWLSYRPWICPITLLAFHLRQSLWPLVVVVYNQYVLKTPSNFTISNGFNMLLYNRRESFDIWGQILKYTILLLNSIFCMGIHKCLSQKLKLAYAANKVWHTNSIHLIIITSLYSIFIFYLLSFSVYVSIPNATLWLLRW